MTAKVLIPLRVPELGPSLGKVITGTGRVAGDFSLEPARYQLATKVIEMAGEARRLAANDERLAALATLGRGAWLAAWEETVAPVTARLVEHLTTHLAAEAAAIGMPKRLRKRVTIKEPERRALGARLGSAGARLIPALDDLEVQSTALRDARVSARGVLEGWQRAQTGVARRLEAAWMALEDGVDEELAAWRRVADEIARWRKPWWPVIATGVVGTAVALWAGLMWGGVATPPALLLDLLRAVGF